MIDDENRGTGPNSTGHEFLSGPSCHCALGTQFAIVPNGQQTKKATCKSPSTYIRHYNQRKTATVVKYYY